MLTAIATLKANPGKEAELQAALTTLVAAVKENEQGQTLIYTCHVADNDPATFIMYEVYADDAAFAAHGKTPHMAAFAGGLRELVAGKIDVVRLTPVARVD